MRGKEEEVRKRGEGDGTLHAVEVQNFILGGHSISW